MITHRSSSGVNVGENFIRVTKVKMKHISLIDEDVEFSSISCTNRMPEQFE